MSKKIRNRFYGVPDVKDAKGFWIKQYLVTTEDAYNYYITRASSVWYNMEKRCKGEYKDCSNNFRDYQAFTEWCQGQYGYMKKDENGKFWALDKDLLVFRNRVYSENTCIFIPESINALFLDRKKSKIRDLPLGCYWNKANNNYNSFITKNAKHIHLGTFTTKEAAHRAWQIAKIEAMLHACGNQEIDDRIVNAIQVRVDRIVKDVDNKRETVFLC